MAGGAVQMTATRSWRHVAAGRLVSGLGVGSLSVGMPMFQSEASPREMRGAVVASYQLMITVGILAANAVHLAARSLHPCAPWRGVMVGGVACALPLAVGVLGLPESPRWLAGPVDADEVEMRDVLDGERRAPTRRASSTARCSAPQSTSCSR